MKMFRIQKCIAPILIMLFSLSLTNCAVKVGPSHGSASAKPLPPGQAKKITGEKSAKNYAPGHNK